MPSVSFHFAFRCTFWAVSRTKPGLGLLVLNRYMCLGPMMNFSAMASCQRCAARTPARSCTRPSLSQHAQNVQHSQAPLSGRRARRKLQFPGPLTSCAKTNKRDLSQGDNGAPHVLGLSTSDSSWCISWSCSMASTTVLLIAGRPRTDRLVLRGRTFRICTQVCSTE